MRFLWRLVGAQGVIDAVKCDAKEAEIESRYLRIQIDEKNSQLRSDYSELKSRNSDLEIRLADRVREIDTLSKECNYLASSAKDIGKKLGDATRENGLLVRQTGEMSRENRALENSIKDITKSRECLRDTYREAEAEIGGLSVKLQEAESDRELWEIKARTQFNNYNRQKAASDTLQSKFEECNEQLAAALLSSLGNDHHSSFTQNTINIGDVVRLKSGGQDMTVNGSEGNGKVLVCVWMRDSKPMDDAFHADTLELVESEPTKCEQSVDEIINDAETTLKANLSTRYHLFAWNRFGSSGGYDDFIGSFPSVEDAITKYNSSSHDRAHIFDTQEGVTVMGCLQDEWHDQYNKPITPNTTSTNEEKAV